LVPLSVLTKCHLNPFNGISTAHEYVTDDRMMIVRQTDHANEKRVAIGLSV